MKKINRTIALLMRPYFYYELPGWGKIYNKIVGDYRFNQLWEGSSPKIWKNKLTGHWHLSIIEEWSDRSGFFLSRWYDKKAWLICNRILKHGDLFLDIGANYGNFSMLAAHCVGSEGHVIAFEPNPASFGRLMTHLRMNSDLHIDATMAALGDREGSAVLSVPEVNSGEATLAKSAYADDAVRQFEVKVLKGDDVLSGKSPRLIKIDVEGWEPNVIVGLTETINRCKPLIYTEVVDQHLRAAGSSSEEFKLQMEAFGYKGQIVRLERGGKKIALSEFISKNGDGDVIWMPLQYNI